MPNDIAFSYPAKDEKWWKEATVFQVWPHSFCDGNGDGIGDLKGIISKLDYLQDLGADAVWLSPIFSSPLADFGYDISDYKNVNHLYGTLDDWDELATQAHKRGMKLIMDLVLNHSSNEHPWFIESQKSRDNPYRDYYIWRDPGPNGELPNLWANVFGGGSAWKFDETTKQYYLHFFAEQQPDLNWDNPKVREEVYSIIQFWIGRGCDGFRLDACNLISKPIGLPDMPKSEWVSAGQPEYHVALNMIHGPHILEYYSEMYEKAFKGHDITVIGEMGMTPPLKALDYIHPSNKRIDMIFSFDHIRLDTDQPMTQRIPFQFVKFKEVLAEWQTFQCRAGGWNSVFLSNHDNPRPLSRFCNDKTDVSRARGGKLLALMEATFFGTLFLYQGEELGFVDYPPDTNVDDFPDIGTINHLKTSVAALKNGTSTFKTEEESSSHTGPTPWDKSKPNAGFSDVTPWMIMNKRDIEWDAKSQMTDPESVFNFWKTVIAVRQKHKTLIYGDFEILDSEHPTIFAYSRIDTETSAHRYFVVLNFSDNPIAYKPTGLKGTKGSLLLGNIVGKELKTDVTEVNLEAWEARLYELAA